MIFVDEREKKERVELWKWWSVRESEGRRWSEEMK